MGQIANKLLRLNTEKHRIREAIGRKDVELTPATPLTAYAPAIDSIDQRKVNPVIPYYDYFRVIFVDYEGTVLKDVYVVRGSAVTPPETVPEHDHLTFQGWTRSDVELGDVQHDMCVGALYEVEGAEDKTNWLYITVNSNQKIRIDGTSVSGLYYTVDWGDGTVETKNGDAIHTYVNAGDYIVKTTNRKVKLDAAASSSTDYSWLSALKKAYLNAFNTLADSSRRHLTALGDVCVGAGAVIPAEAQEIVLPAGVRAFVMGEAAHPISVKTLGTGKFFFSVSTAFTLNMYGPGHTPVLDLLPNSRLAAGDVNRVAWPSEIAAPTTITNGSTHVCLVGDTFGGGYLTAFCTIIIEDGATPRSDVRVNFAILENAWEFLASLGEVSQAITITLTNVNEGYRDSISAALTAKGYTVAFE